MSGLYGQEETKFERHKFVTELPTIGTLTLELSEAYQGMRRANFVWIFMPVNATWELKDGQVMIYRQPCPSPKMPTPDLAFVLQPQPDGSLQFVQGGFLDQKRLDFFGPCLLKPADDLHSKEYTLFHQAREQRKRFVERGTLKPLPESFPRAFMDATALLFRDRVHEIDPILKHPQISTDVLDVIGTAMLNQEAGDQSSHILPDLGVHSNVSATMQDRLFAVPKAPTTWRAVACNPTASKKYYPEYLKRIREGDKLIRIYVARDGFAPREAWELAIAQNEPEVSSELARNKNVPSDLLEKVFKQTELRDPSDLASNEATPASILEKLSTSTDKQVLWALKRNPSTPPAVVERVLRTMASSSSALLRSTSVDDPRLPDDLIRKLAKDVIIQVRLVLAMNKAVPLDVLEDLAKDPYRMVSERARDNIKARFPEVYQARQSEWRPLEQLNPNENLCADFTDAVKTGDVVRARKTLAATDDPEEKPSDSAIITIILRENFLMFKELLMETVQNGTPTTHEILVVSGELKPAHISWMLQAGLLDEPKWRERLVEVATENGRNDLLNECKRLDLIHSLPQIVKDSGLFTATALRNRVLVEFWLSEGGQSNQVIGPRKMTAVDVAAKMYSVDILKRLDAKGQYATLLAEITKEFPPTPKSPLLGKWSNKRDGFTTVAFILGPDGTGYMGASISSLPILWKPETGDTLRIIVVGPDGPMKDQPIVLHYDAAKDVLTVDKSNTKSSVATGIDPSPFYRLEK